MSINIRGSDGVRSSDYSKSGKFDEPLSPLSPLSPMNDTDIKDILDSEHDSVSLSFEERVQDHNAGIDVSDPVKIHKKDPEEKVKKTDDAEKTDMGTAALNSERFGED